MSARLLNPKHHPNLISTSQNFASFTNNKRNYTYMKQRYIYTDGANGGIAYLYAVTDEFVPLRLGQSLQHRYTRHKMKLFQLRHAVQQIEAEGHFNN